MQEQGTLRITDVKYIHAMRSAHATHENFRRIRAQYTSSVVCRRYDAHRICNIRRDWCRSHLR
ncbi:hypothetical protein OH77DRAFT_1431116 [Trametes cingulata]|nr:hypothetical protein OH77DRAFT_1431116 [Trametes cingulata]